MVILFFVLTFFLAINPTSGVSNTIFEAISGDDEFSLLQFASDKDVLDKKGPGKQTPLMAAVLGGKDKAVAILLEKGANVNLGEQNGYRPMHGAGFQGRSKIAQMLIDHGINPNTKHKQDGHKPIIRACWGNEKRHTDTVHVFLKAGVDSATDIKKCLEMTKNQGTIELLKDWDEMKVKAKASGQQEAEL